VKRVAIVGAGISGLATAFYLNRSRPDLAVTVLDRENRLGGVITTRREGGFLIEGGPDSFVTLKPWGTQLCRDLGMEKSLIGTSPENRKVYVLSRSRLEELPPGMLFSVPTRIAPLLRTRLISWPGKIRMGLDLLLPRGAEREDESLGSFVRRRLGQEAVDKIAEPILGGIFLAEADRLSLRSTFPRFLEMEKKHRSLILAFRRESKSPGDGSPFRTPSGGMQALVDALRSALSGVEFRTGTSVETLEAPGRLATVAGVVEADAVVLAVPPPDCARILRGFAPRVAAEVEKIPTVSTATVSLGYSRAESSHPLDATGFVIARGENRRILACTWSSEKFSGRAPEGGLLVRIFFGGGKREDVLQADDGDLIRIAREELSSIMGLGGEPAVTAVYRWPRANPIYEVGHGRRVARIESLLDPAWRLHLCGSGFRGIGIPDCVGDAIRVAGDIASGI
jgi:oxygen-dependent protoporphyrinogen oxidase